MKKPTRASGFQLTVIVIASIVALSLTMPDLAEAGFTPTPPPPTNTPPRPTSTPIPPTAAPTQPPKKKKPSNKPAAAEPIPESTPEATPNPPLPTTGSTKWQPTMILLLWAVSLPLALPMIGSLGKRKRKRVSPQPSNAGGKHDTADDDV
jgi:outer membrane biosynthesis protein TonB